MNNQKCVIHENIYIIYFDVKYMLLYDIYTTMCNIYNVIQIKKYNI